MARNFDADSLITFLNASPTSYHAVEEAAQKLQTLGAKKLDEKTSWNLKPGELVYTIRNASSIIAFRLPEIFDADKNTFHIIAAHTDSPCLKLKPNAQSSIANYQKWGVEVYGGVLYNSWLDRDLGLAGRITKHNASGLHSFLARMEMKPLRIPQLAIHLDRNVNENGLILNAQRHLSPILGLTDGDSTKGRYNSSANLSPNSPSAFSQSSSHGLENWLTEIAAAPLEEITFDLHLFDTSPAGYGGLDDEFIYSGRLDNLAMTHAALEALSRETASKYTVQMIALFDHEEVGSTSAQGANSNLLETVLERCNIAFGNSREQALAMQARSEMISADMAHAIHPNYPEKHDPEHFPLLNHGPVIKGNANQRYATTAETAARFKQVCQKAGIPVQNFVSRSDLACGTTIGPHLAASLGINTIDIGNPMLSMHSAREMGGSEDHGMMIRALRMFLQ